MNSLVISRVGLLLAKALQPSGVFEIVEGPDFQKTLKPLRLKPPEIEEMREALDWKLSRAPESGQKVDAEKGITIFYESYLLRADYYLLIAYTIEGETVILQEIHKDLSQMF